MPSSPTGFKKLQVTRCTGLLTSRDTYCRFLAHRQSDHDKGTANKFLAAVEANQIVSQHPELSRKQISQHAATEGTEADTQLTCTTHRACREKWISCSKRTKQMISGQ